MTLEEYMKYKKDTNELLVNSSLWGSKEQEIKKFLIEHNMRVFLHRSMRLYFLLTICLQNEITSFTIEDRIGNTRRYLGTRKEDIIAEFSHISKAKLNERPIAFFDLIQKDYIVLETEKLHTIRIDIEYIID